MPFESRIAGDASVKMVQGSQFPHLCRNSSSSSETRAYDTLGVAVNLNFVNARSRAGIDWWLLSSLNESSDAWEAVAAIDRNTIGRVNRNDEAYSQ